MECLLTEIQNEDVLLAEDFKTLKNVKDLANKKLCIIKTDFRNLFKIKRFFKKYPDIKVWLTSGEISRKNIFAANLNGFSNIVQYPVNPQLIRNFLNDKNSEKNEPKCDKKEIEINNSKVMIVDDNPMNIDLLVEALKSPQLFLSTFLKPIDAIKVIENERFDLFLIDIMMPDISGFDLAKIIKKSKINSDVPIMFISALSDSDSKIQSYNLGSVAYIEKPFDVTVVRAQVFNTLKTKGLQDALNDKKETFFAMVTHDLKSPVNAEISALEFLLQNQKNNMNEFQTEIIGDILGAAKYMKTLVDNILHKYRYDNGVLSIKPQMFSLNGIIIQCIEETKYIFEDKAQKVKYTCSVKNSDTMLDYIEIKRVINNLMVNAMEYGTKKSNVYLTLKEDDKNLIFSIKNDGIGIDLENPNEIFEKYVSYAEKYKKIGTGLGLYIAKRIVEAHHGTISVKSKVDKFTEISFCIPKVV